eukprot:TRINITY_DN1498_c0_g1_i1.p1 TRINITY_DN1498_c0_g1~~TRINITY_DN1498_c0_g1_i1.p1  ORF type:complete len:408 (+),score=108.79 TRINITY_DN1498_c0_g1_i1:63-1226(+)
MTDGRGSPQPQSSARVLLLAGGLLLLLGGMLAGSVSPRQRTGKDLGGFVTTPEAVAAQGGGSRPSWSIRVSPSCAATRHALDRDGYVVLRDFYPPQTMKPIISELEQVVSEVAAKRLQEGSIPETYSELPLQSRLIKLFEGREHEVPKYFRRELHRHNFFRLVAHPPMLSLMKCLLNTTELRLYPVYMLRGVLPRVKDQVVPWHQDSEYTYKWFSPPGTNMDDMSTHTRGLLNTWTALDDVSAETSPLWVSTGSHKCGMTTHTRHKNGSAVWLELPQKRVAECGPSHAVPLKRGDTLLFHALTMHRGSANVDARIRWSTDLRYQDARLPTLREGFHPGFPLCSSDRTQPLIDTPAKWASAPWARRFKESVSKQTLARVAENSQAKKS